MENEKVLTISIAAYNVEKYLDNTLNSLICNKMDKLEVIIQNDGSKDSTCEVAKKYDWYEVKCVKENKIRTIEDIHEEIYQEIRKYI